MASPDLPPLAVSMGEPAGIGPDLILKLYAEREQHGLPPFILYGNSKFLRTRAERLGLKIDTRESMPSLAAGVFPTALPVAEVEGLVPDKPGDTSPLSSSVVLEAITRAVRDTLTGAARGVVTAPIHKRALQLSGFRHPGHTEFIAELCSNGGAPKQPVMMLLHEDLRVVPLTVHVPLSAVAPMITAELIRSTVEIVVHDLRTRFSIAEPRIGVAGLNPHAGEGGSIGREDGEIIAPAVAGLAADGIAITGPVPADTMFYPPHWRRYDAVIAMYHDQALIPIKTVAFDSAVNLTLGLPLVRTSPDHGTAFDLAGTGNGSTASFLAALKLADRLTSGGSVSGGAG